MTDLIRVDHEALAKIAANFGQEATATAQMLQQVTQAMQTLRNGWMGRGSTAFFAEMEQKVIPAVRRLIEALAEAERTTKTISTLMKSADEEASSGLREDITNGSGAGAGSGLGSSSGSGGAATDSQGGDGSGSSGGGASAGAGNGGNGGGDSSGGFTTDTGSGYGNGFTADGGMGSGDYGAGTGLYDGGLGMAADDINSLLDAGSAFWGNDDLLNGDGLYGDTLDSNFFPGDYTGSDFLHDPYGGELGNAPYGFDATTDYGIPSDWLSGVTDSLSDYLQQHYNDAGIPQDWLADVHDGVLDDLRGDGLEDDALRDSGGSDSGSGGSDSGGGSSGGGSGAGGTGNADTPVAEAAPLSESGMGSGSGGGTGGGSGGGMPSLMPESNLGSGSMGGGMPSSFERMPSGLVGPDSGEAFAQSTPAVRAPIRFAYQALGNSGIEQSSRTFTSMGAGGGVLPAAAPTQANLGLPLSLAALSPFLALFGKALKRKAADR